MAVRIRLLRMGRRHYPFYRIVAADSRSPRDGKYLEEIGYYDPNAEPPKVKIDKEKLQNWLKKGAQLTSAVKSLLKFAE
ncbi:MAG TPA: 30S ribosomal protein S16 [bacterium]|nr:30S ribosomal protein S16 [bacterium]HEX68605.1 30S ribosomal protein S16 [bacterium]